MVADDAGGADKVDETIFARAEAEIIILKTVPIIFVKSSGPQEPLATNGATRGGDAGKFGVLAAGLRDRQRFAVVDGITAIAEDDAGVIDFAALRIELDVADHAGARMAYECRQHGFKPAGLEDEIVVEQHQKFTLRDAGGAIVRRGVAEIANVEQHDARRRQVAEKIARAVARAIVDQNNFMRQAGRHGRFERRETCLGERKLIEDWNNKRDLHSRDFGNRARGCLMIIVRQIQPAHDYGAS